MKQELKNTFDTTYLSIEYDPAKRLYYNCWKGYITPGNIKEGSVTYLTMLQENPCPRLLIDNQRVVGSWKKALDWLTKDWAPLAMKAGLKWVAIVVSPGSFAVEAAEELQKRVGGIHLQVKVFTDIDTSMTWLERQVY